MKEHPFTSLCELLKKHDPKVLSIFDRYAVNSSVQQNQAKPRLTEMLIATSPIQYKDNANKRIEELLARISNCGDNYSSVYLEMGKVLTIDGIGKLLLLLKDKLPDQFLEGDNIKYLFKGMPIFKIMVVDNKIEYWRQNKTVGKYDIKFVHTGTNIPDEFPIKFDTIAAKALFLSFLLIPRNKVFNIIQIKPVLKKIIEKSFDYNMDIFDSFDNFGSLIKNTKPIANRNIKAALNERDDDNWYIIDYEKNQPQYYSLSLPEDMIELIGCPDLLVFKEELLSTIK